MLTAIVSDLHIGSASDADISLRPRVRERLFEAIAGADRVVLLGDLLEMRERPSRDVLERAGPFLDELGEATAGKQVVITPGNHDHELVGPALDEAQLDGAGPLGVAATFSPASGELSRRVAARMPGAEVTIAYPGVWLRDDVYATHGHYLDLHLTVPRVECVLASAIERFAGSERDGAGRTPDVYEASLAPIYAFAYSVVQSSEARAITGGGSFSRKVWSRANPGGRASLAGLALGRLAIPGAVAAINRLGLGPFRSDISAVELRRAGLRAIAEVLRGLGIEADHVIFGHTHRAGPLAGEAEGWWLPGGTRLTNTGSWIWEGAFVHGSGAGNPYWPGRVTLLRDEGPPEQVHALDGLDPEDIAPPAAES